MRVERPADPVPSLYMETVGTDFVDPSCIWRMLLRCRAWMPGNGAGGGRALLWRASTKQAADRWLGPPGTPAAHFNRPQASLLH